MCTHNDSSQMMCLLDVENYTTSISSDDNREVSDVINGTEEELRFSIPSEVHRRKHSGYMVRPRNPGSRNSPSTVSTSSLAQLHEKLAALPRYKYDKEPVSVCVQPQLSNVTEVSESEENHTLSTIKLRTYGVCQKKKLNKIDSKVTDMSRSTEDSDGNNSKILSPVLKDDENSISCLLLATIGSADNSVISDTIDRLPKNVECNTDNIVDLLAQEALQGSGIVIDRDFSTADYQDISNSQPINYFQVNKDICKNDKSAEIIQENVSTKEKNNILINLPATDELSYEIVENTPATYITIQRGKHVNNKNPLKTKDESKKKPDGVKLVYDNQAIEEFFSQHCTENNNRDIVVSPSLARKINETSSESSDDFSIVKHMEQDVKIDEIPDLDIVECLNAMVDKVCQDLNRCAKYILDTDLVEEVINGLPVANNTQKNLAINPIDTSKNSSDVENSIKKNTLQQKTKPTKEVKLKFPKKKTLSCKKTSKKLNKPTKQPRFSIMSPIIERESVIEDTATRNVVSPTNAPKASDTVTPVIKRKRKLYSPKDDMSNAKTDFCVVESTEDEITINSELKVNSRTPKLAATCYKELEQERKRRIRRPRIRKSIKSNASPMSPKTQKMNQIFDSLKDVNDSKLVTLVDKKDDAVYNYTGDSEDEDLKKMALRTGANIQSSKPRMTRVRTRKEVKEFENAENAEPLDDRNKNNPKRRRNLSTKKNSTKHHKEIVPKPSISKENLEDERMRREAPEILNSSLAMECLNDVIEIPDKEPDPVLKKTPEMEYISDINCKSEDRDQSNKQKKPKTKRTLSLKRNKDTPKTRVEINMADFEGTVSPLPGLVVEPVLTTDVDVNDSISTNMLQKCMDIFQGKQAAESEVNTTHNLLSDYEPMCDNTSRLNVTEQQRQSPDKVSKDSTKIVEQKNNAKKNIKKSEPRKLKVKRERKSVKSQATDEIIELSVTEPDLERSMATIANSPSPITGHGDCDERPPDPLSLDENIPPRLVEHEFLNQSLQDFLMKLTKVANSNSSNSDEKVSEKNFNTEIDDNSSCKTKSSKSPVVVLQRLSPENIRALSRSSVSSATNDVKTNLKTTSRSRTLRERILKTRDTNKTINDPHVTPKAKHSEPTRKSIISPIRLLDFKVMNSNVDFEDDEYLKLIRSQHGKQKAGTESNEKERRRRYPTRSVKNTLVTSSPAPTETSVVEEAGRESVSSTAESGAAKRRLSPILACPSSAKRSKFEGNNIGDSLTESGVSAASVNEWFKRNEPKSTAEDTSSIYKEIIKDILEKLDTTLVEIHHNSSKRFINMFVEAQKRLDEVRRARLTLQREAAARVVLAVVNAVDEQFLDINNKFEAMDKQLMESLRESAHEVMREECGQKRALVALLRDDVRAALARGGSGGGGAR